MANSNMDFLIEGANPTAQYMNNAPLKHPFFTYEIFSGDLGTLPTPSNGDSSYLISTINPHSFYVADHDPEFRTALEQSQILLPDGIGIVYANWLINRSRIRKISGMDVFLFLLRKLESDPSAERKRIFFLGSSESTLKLIKAKISREFPSLTVGTFSPPFKASFSADEISAMIKSINDFSPYALFVGMTAPKQEKWSYLNKNHLRVKIICSIGAVFDFYCGNVRRPGKLWQHLGLEWFVRFVQEPRRLWKRSFISLPYFLLKVIKDTLRKQLE